MGQDSSNTFRLLEKKHFLLSFIVSIIAIALITWRLYILLRGVPMVKDFHNISFIILEMFYIFEVFSIKSASRFYYWLITFILTIYCNLIFIFEDFVPFKTRKS